VTLTPWFFESLVLAMIGLSGVAGGVAVGWRHPLLLAGGAVLVSGTIRVFTSLSVWSLGSSTLIQESWWWASARRAEKNLRAWSSYVEGVTKP